MRCTNCNGLAVPQAVGRTREGLLVFGWCLDCLEREGCRDVVVARRTRPPLPPPRPALAPVPAVRVAPPAPTTHEADDRRKVVATVALVLALWGLAVFGVGLNLRSRTDPRQASPLGNGTPPLLIFGGGATAAVGLILWASISGAAVVRSRVGLKAVQVVAFLTAVVTLAVGILLHSPRRDPLIVVLTSVALAVSVAARWLEARRFRPMSSGGGRWPVAGGR